MDNSPQQPGPNGDDQNRPPLAPPPADQSFNAPPVPGPGPQGQPGRFGPPPPGAVPPFGSGAQYPQPQQPVFPPPAPPVPQPGGSPEGVWPPARPQARPPVAAPVPPPPQFGYQQQGFGGPPAPQYPPAVPSAPVPPPPAFQQQVAPAPAYQQPAAAPYPAPAPMAPGGAGGFSMAHVFDGTNPDGSPLINRPRLSPYEMQRLAAYLNGAPIALSAPGTTRDELTPDAPPAVPRAFHTDGMWIWPGAIGYYLTRYELPPQAELLAHIRSRGFAPTPVPPAALQAAAKLILMTLTQSAPQPPGSSGPRPDPLASSGGGSARSSSSGGSDAAEPSVSAALFDQALATVLVRVADAQSPPIQAPPAPARAAATPPAAAPSPSPFAKPPKPAPAAPAQPAPRTAAVEQVEEFSGQFVAAGNKHAAWVSEQIAAFLEYLPEGDWTLDRVSRRYKQGDRGFIVDALGTLSDDGVWTWAWAEPDRWLSSEAMLASSRRLKEVGGRLGIAEFGNERCGLAEAADSDGDPATAAEMISWTAMGLLGARGYIGRPAGPAEGGGRVYCLVFDKAVPLVEPTAQGVVEYLTEGVGAFAEDTADCVIGYAEHHEWEWSRVPGGIKVAATGLGTVFAHLNDEGGLAQVTIEAAAVSAGAA
jgi:hypothetical protein